MKSVGKVFWLYGRSGAGKTTLALRLQKGLAHRNVPVVMLDGDNLRATLCSDLGFNPIARLENHRRIAEIAKLLGDQGLNVVVSTMAPEYHQRDLVSQILGLRLIWFYIHAPLEVCIQRDPKGIYKRALEGKIGQLIDYPFEDPRAQEGQYPVDTTRLDEQSCFELMLGVVRTKLADYSI